MRLTALFRRPASALWIIGLGGLAPASAQDLTWPDAADRVVTALRIGDTAQIATGAFHNGEVPSDTVTGDVLEEIWHIPSDGADVGAVATQLRQDLERQGYNVTYACQDRLCGGFDFRFALPIPLGPEMFVDVGAFTYLTASGLGPDGPQHVAITLSHGGALTYAHVLRVAPPGAPEAQAVTASSRTAPRTPVERPTGAENTLVPKLLALGSSPLDDLSFTSGSASLSDGTYTSLAILAAFLAEDASRRVVLVGHTDTDGGLEANIRLSQARAEAVRARLLSSHGTAPGQVEARGIGYLAPRTSNDSPEGRTANRRVEVVLIAQ